MCVFIYVYRSWSSVRSTFNYRVPGLNEGIEGMNVGTIHKMQQGCLHGQAHERTRDDLMT